MENTCKFVNSRGILKSCHFHSFSPKSSCNNDYEYLLKLLASQFNGMSIYVCSDLLKFFVDKILPKIEKRFTLVSGDSDLSNPLESLMKTQNDYLLSHPLLIRWFSQNVLFKPHEKIILMPIGLDYHTILTNPNHRWRLPNEGYLPLEQEKKLCDVKESAFPFYDRTSKIYVNFYFGNDRFGDRKKSINTIPSDLMVINSQFTPRTINWNNMSKYAFVLSPFGIGMDCHRTWEALCLGCIPILRAPNLRKLFDDLPVLIVDNWSEVNSELLDSTLNKFKEKQFNYEKLSLSFWVEQINIAF
jgi:hypothetical protein